MVVVCFKVTEIQTKVSQTTLDLIFECAKIYHMLLTICRIVWKFKLKYPSVDA